MRLRWELVTPPAGEPVTLAELKAQLRLDTDDDDELVTALGKAARQVVEIYLGRAIVEQTQRAVIDYQWPRDVIRLPNPPLQSVTSITYLDGGGVEQTLDSSLYVVDTVSAPGRIDRAYSATWPLVRSELNAIKVTYVCGHAPGSGSPEDFGFNVPETWKHAIKLLTVHLYDHRGPVNVGNIVNALPWTVEALLHPDRLVPVA